jgi:hypothetical protein
VESSYPGVSCYSCIYPERLTKAPKSLRYLVPGLVSIQALPKCTPEALLLNLACPAVPLMSVLTLGMKTLGHEHISLVCQVVSQVLRCRIHCENHWYELRDKRMETGKEKVINKVN